MRRSETRWGLGPAETTKPVEGTTKLGNQIARLMAALTRAGQGNNPAVLQIALDTETIGEDGQTGTLLVTPTPIMGKLVWDRQPQSTSYLLVVAQGLQVKARKMPKYPKIPTEALQMGRTPVPYSASGAKVGVTWLGNVPPQQTLNPSGGTEGMWPYPLPTNRRPPAFPHWPQTKANHTQRSTKERMTKGHPCPFS